MYTAGYSERANPVTDHIRIRMIKEGSRFPLDNRQPGRNTGSPTIPQAVVILIHIAEIPLDPRPCIDYTV